MHTNFQQNAYQPNKFTTPEAMLQGLLSSLDHPCNCGTVQTDCECQEQQVNEQIKDLQVEVNNIRSQIVEVQNLLQIRDKLYSQLDELREERQQIQTEIESQMSIGQTQIVKTTGYKEMNERLRRRIYQVRQYIQKMTFQNQKIEEGIITSHYTQQEEELQIKRKDIFTQSQSPVYEGRKNYFTNFDTMVGKLHEKQEEAWRKVKRQEEDIQRRNAQARSRKTNGFTYYSPKARTYYSPSREIF